MIKNLTLLFIGIVVCIGTTFSQGQFDCEDAEDNALCELAAIDGSSFTNPPPGGGVPSDPFCDGGVFNNPGWFSFVAGGTSIQLTVTPNPATCDTTSGGQTGVQVALWEGCPGAGGSCIAGDADCYDTPVDLPANGLTIGEIYSIVIDGCAGSICTVEVSINEADAFELPPLEDLDIPDARYDTGRMGPCDSSLPDNSFCAGQDVIFQLDDDFYNFLGAEWYWEFTGPDADDIDWSFGSFSGTGSDAQIGDLNSEPGGNGIILSFPTNGVYQVCLDNVVTECDTDADGPICWEVTIITPGDQEFGEYDVCRLDAIFGWDPSEFDIVDENGNDWTAGPISLDMIEANDGRVEVETIDDCGCEFTQIIDINLKGSLERVDLELFIWECMLPYEWYDEDFDDLGDLPEALDFVLESVESDFEDELCDSLVNLTITPLSMEGEVITGDCTSQGTEFTFLFTALDQFGNVVNVQTPIYTWKDAFTGMEVANGQTVFLETGSYIIEFESFILDLNFVDGNLAGIEEDHPCDFNFGPFNLVGGSSVDPDINAYDQVYCDDELNLLTFSIDTLPDTDYSWIMPASYDTIFISEDSLAVAIQSYVPTDTLFVVASNECGSSDSIPLPIMVIDGPAVLFSGQPLVCDGQEYLTGYDGDPSFIQSYLWDVPDGTITTGDNMSQNIGISYDDAGDYEYTLTVTDLDGCTSSESFSVTVEENIAAPVVTCDGDPSQIIFTWEDISGATGYDVQEVDLPAGSTGTLNGTSFVVTGINGGDEAIIIVTATGNTSCIEAGEEVSCIAPGCDFSGVVNDNFFDFAICQGDTNNLEIQFQIELPQGYTGTFTGNGLTADGFFDPFSTDLVQGANMLEFNYSDPTGCNGTIPAVVTVNPTPDASFTPSMSTLCVGESITLDGASADGIYTYGAGFEGDFNALSYRTSGDKLIAVSLTDPATGCRDDFEVNISVLDTVPAPLVSCTPGTTSVDFDWDDHPLASEYEVTVVINGGAPQVTTQTDSDFSQQNLIEGDQVDITVSVTASNGCNTAVTSETCEAKACIVPDIVLTSDEMEFCNNGTLDAIQIMASVDGATPAANTFQWIGTGVDMDGMFDPSAINPGITRITFRYTNPADNCVTSESIDFELFEVPVPDYTVSSDVLCIDEMLTLSLEAAPANVIPRIETDGGMETAISPDEYEIGWNNPGTYNISVGYTLGNCPEEVLPMMITVQDTIRTPVVDCVDSDTDFIEFDWQDQNNVTEYEVYIDGILAGTQSDTEFLLSDIDPAQDVEIRVVAVDEECGNKEGTQLCRSEDCVAPSWNADVPAELCYQAGSGSILLDVSAISGSMGSGNIEWLSAEVDADGNFTPADTSQDYALTASYVEKNCRFDTTFNVRVNIIPEAQLELVGTDVICVGSSVTVQSNFSASAGETAIWDFDGGMEIGSDFGPYDVSFDTPGTYTIGLSVDNNGCIGPDETVSIIVEEELIAPVVACSSSDINEINISWDIVDCAQEYRVLVDGSEVTTTNDTEFALTGLIENQEVDIVIEAISECACDNVMSQTFTCATKACIEPDWIINVDDEICWEPSLGAILLDVRAESNDPTLNGSLSWPSPLVDDDGNFTPNNVSQDYSFIVVFDEGECSFEQTVDIRVNIIPEAQLEILSERVICEGSTVEITSNYNPLDNEVINWNFDGGVVTSGGAGFVPFNVRYDVPGNYTVSVFVDNAGCEGDVESIQVEVQEELIAPVINCSSDDINSIDLTWDLVDCASEYTIFVDGILDGSTSNTTYTISGLNENEEVEVLIEAISQCACDNVQSQTVSCNSKPCDPTNWSFSSNTLNEICLDANASTYTISATPDDLQGGGSGFWTGAAISDPSGTVDPSLVGPGTYEFVYSYSEGGCDYLAPTLEITFVEEPQLSLSAMDPACPMDQTGVIMAEGMGGASGYSYSLDGGMPQQSGNFTEVSIGSHSVEIIDANGCINTAQINLFAPLTPEVNISGPNTLISENDATYEVEIINADNVEDIIWTSGGQIVCSGLNCTSYTVANAISDFDLSVEVIYNGGCMAFSETYLVDVKEIQAYYIPNTVSLGGPPDVNSRWTMFIKGNETFPKSIKVYTRWGNLIYDELFPPPADLESRSEVELWDGNSGNNQVESGVYVYALEIETEGRTEFVVGDVTILR